MEKSGPYTLEQMAAIFCASREGGDFACDEVLQMLRHKYADAAALNADMAAVQARVQADLAAREYSLSPDGSAILCGRCRKISHNPQDVALRFCGFCKSFHQET